MRDYWVIIENDIIIGTRETKVGKVSVADVLVEYGDRDDPTAFKVPKGEYEIAKDNINSKYSDIFD